MSKYEPLTTYLSGKRLTSIPMTFEKIEGVVGVKLPPSAYNHRAWWSNNPTNNVMTYAWLKAGYKTASVDMEGRKLVFLMFEESEQTNPLPGASGKQRASGKSFDKADAGVFLRISGVLKGTVTISPGVDLTSPVGEQWDAAE